MNYSHICSNVSDCNVVYKESIWFHSISLARFLWMYLNGFLFEIPLWFLDLFLFYSNTFHRSFLLYFYFMISMYFFLLIFTFPLLRLLHFSCSLMFVRFYSRLTTSKRWLKNLTKNFFNSALLFSFATNGINRITTTISLSRLCKAQTSKQIYNCYFCESNRIWKLVLQSNEVYRCSACPVFGYFIDW